MQFLFTDILATLDWVVAWLLEQTYQHSTELQHKGMSAFNVRNNNQVFNAQTLSIVYAQVSRLNTRTIQEIFIS